MLSCSSARVPPDLPERLSPRDFASFETVADSLEAAALALAGPARETFLSEFFGFSVATLDFVSIWISSRVWGAVETVSPRDLARFVETVAEGLAGAALDLAGPPRESFSAELPDFPIAAFDFLFTCEPFHLFEARVEDRALLGLRVPLVTTVLLCVCLRLTLVFGRFCFADVARFAADSSPFPLDSLSLSFLPGTSFSWSLTIGFSEPQPVIASVKDESKRVQIIVGESQWTP